MIDKKPEKEKEVEFSDLPYEAQDAIIKAHIALRICDIRFSLLLVHRSCLQCKNYFP